MTNSHLLKSIYQRGKKKHLESTDHCQIMIKRLFKKIGPDDNLEHYQNIIYFLKILLKSIKNISAVLCKKTNKCQKKKNLFGTGKIKNKQKKNR